MKKSDLTPEDLANAIEGLKKDIMRMKLQISELSKPKVGSKEWLESFEQRPEPEIGDTVHYGVNKKIYRGNGVWDTILLYDSQEFNKEGKK